VAGDRYVVKGARCGRDSGVVIDIPKTIGGLQACRHILFGGINGAECP